jgi:putative DNA primase/helicase
MRLEELMAGPPQVDWVVDGVLPAKRRALLYAESGVGKSFTALDMGLHIATGKSWQGRRVHQGPVYYVAAENPEDFYGPVQAWEKHHKGIAHYQADVPFTFDPVPIDLSSPASMDALLARLGPARLVVIDTLMAALGSWDVLNFNQSNLARSQIDRIIAKTGATVLVIGHTPESGQNPIGGSIWKGPMQTRILLTRKRGAKRIGEDDSFQDGDTIVLDCKKQTGAPQFDDIAIPVKLVKVEPGLTVPVLTSEVAAKVKSAHALRQQRYREKSEVTLKRGKVLIMTPRDAKSDAS